MIIAIVAISKNLAIGRGGGIPWHFSEDLKFFKRTTTGHPIVMGYNTWKSLGRPLPNRLNIVLSRSRSVDPDPNVRLMRNKDEVIEFARGQDRDLFIIGGAAIYRTFADVIDRWIVTEIPVTIDDADAFLADGFLDGFELASSEVLGEGLTVKTYEKMP
ncbi:MAG TPA: dihydrofolate reductase [Pyrinomonadaceae bacterium]|nr:dihydrofolate reductase [Pyrinomonadaceae bacterium]